mmetsp:Transcript_35899/g.78914  ORF Transcript_35899/g.78914 Transcript_35899/m.78914 type:complete len:390 (-) Transcript_35899:337-1506(-)
MAAQLDSGAAFELSLSLDNGCVRFFNDSGSSWLSEVLATAPQHLYTVLHGWNEIVLGYSKMLVAKQASARKLRRCIRLSGTGVMLPLSLNNIFHATFHAVPAAERWAQAAAASSSEIHFIPLVYRSAAFGVVRSADPRSWFAWEYTIRAMTRLSGAEIARRTSEILNAGCCCFERLEAAAPPFNAYARSSRERLYRFRRAVLGNVLSANEMQSDAQRRRTRVLYIPREHEDRAITNEAEVSRSLRALPNVERLVFDRLSLSEQLRHVSEAIGLVSVFGQALVWMVFLPAQHMRTFVVELVQHEGAWKQDYVRWAATLGVRHFRSRGDMAACKPDSSALHRAWQRKLRNYTRFIDCNLTVLAADVVEKTGAGIAWARGGNGDVVRRRDRG